VNVIIIIIIIIIIITFPQRQAMTGKELFCSREFRSVLVQRYNAVLLHDTLSATDCKD